MKNYPFPFAKVWYGIDIEDIHPHKSDFATYEGSPFDLLPAIDEHHLDGSFDYLSNEVIRNLEKNPDNAHLDITFKSTSDNSIWEENKKWSAKLATIQATLPTPLPKGLLKFMAATTAQGLIPSCTACYFDLPDEATPFQYLGEDGYIFHFYRDQQDCVFWYYYVRKTGETCILASCLPFGLHEPEQFSEELVQHEVFFTANSFEEFIYRTWIENILWFESNEGEKLDANTAHHAELYRQRYGANA
jgi:hypothetical protein